MSKTYVIADLHGRYDLLVKAFEMINARISLDNGDMVITLGDYIDRGPQSMQILQYLRAFQGCEGAGKHLICLAGNHEDMMLKTVMTPTAQMLNWWIGNGGGATLISYGHPKQGNVSLSHLDADDLVWLSTRPLFHMDEHRIYVHAGVDHNLPMEEQSEETLLWRIYKPRDDDFEGWHQEVPYRSPPVGPKRHIVHGHHQHKEPKLHPGRTDLDTFAWKTGRLAIGVFDSETPGGPVEVLWAEGPTYEAFMAAQPQAA